MPIPNSKPWIEQPPPDTLLSGEIPTPIMIFRPTGAVQVHRGYPGISVSSSAYTGITAVETPQGRGLKSAGSTNDGIEHVISQALNRNQYAVAVMFRVENVSGNQAIVSLNAGTTGDPYLRLNSSAQLELVAESVSLLNTTSFSGYTAGTIHTAVFIQKESGGNLDLYSNGIFRFSVSGGRTLSAGVTNTAFARRQQTGEKFTGTIIEAAVWSGIVPTAVQAKEISFDYYGKMFTPKNSVKEIPSGFPAGPRIHYVIYPSTETRFPQQDDVVKGWPSVGVTSGWQNISLNSGDITFQADATALTPSTNYKIAYCWYDGLNYSPVELTTFTTSGGIPTLSSVTLYNITTTTARPRVTITF